MPKRKTIKRKPNEYQPCTACGKQISSLKDVAHHPQIKTIICIPCNRTHLEVGDLSTYRNGVDIDGENNYCRWCLDGGELVGCGQKGCNQRWCNFCIERNFGKRRVKAISNMSDWYCFICDPSQLKPLMSKSKLTIPYTLEVPSQPKRAKPDQELKNPIIKNATPDIVPIPKIIIKPLEPRNHKTPTSAPEKRSERAPERASEKEPGKASVKTPERASFREPVRATEREPEIGLIKAPDRAPVRATEREPDNASVKAPERVPVRAPERATEKELDKASIKGPERAPIRGPERAPEKESDQVSIKAPERAPPREPERAPEKAPARALEREPDKALDKASVKAPERATVRAPFRTPEREPDKATVKASVKAPERSTVRAPFRPPEREPDKTSSRAPERTPIRATVRVPEKEPDKAPAGPPEKPLSIVSNKMNLNIFSATRFNLAPEPERFESQDDDIIESIEAELSQNIENESPETLADELFLSSDEEGDVIAKNIVDISEEDDTFDINSVAVSDTILLNDRITDLSETLLDSVRDFDKSGNTSSLVGHLSNIITFLSAANPIQKRCQELLELVKETSDH